MDLIDRARQQREIEGEAKYGRVSPKEDQRCFRQKIIEKLLDALNYTEWAEKKGDVSFGVFCLIEKDLKHIINNLTCDEKYPNLIELTKRLEEEWDKCHQHNKLLIPEEVAERLQMPLKRVKLYMRYNVIPCHRMTPQSYRTFEWEIEEWIAKKEEPKIKRRIHWKEPKMLTYRISSLLRYALKHNRRGAYWEKLLGYTLDDLRRRLKRSIPIGYEWDDFLNGKLHIDHIIPVSVFNITSINCLDLKRCWALQNLQLLPAIENIKKSNKLTNPFQPGLSLRVSL